MTHAATNGDVFRILVADDNSSDVFVLREALKSLSHPCHVDWVKNGSEAFDFLYGRGLHTRAPRPHLILLDLNMPGFSGLEVLREVKLDPELRTIPVIILSSSSWPADVQQSYLAHANSFLQKPASLGNLTRLVQAIEAFWMNVAILPCKNGDAESAFCAKTATATYGNVLSGPEIFPHPGKLKNQVVRSQGTEAVRPKSVPGKVGCEEHRRLLDEFGEAVRELLTLHEDQFRATVEDDGDSSRFDLLIYRANERKQLAKHAYVRHAESHGCANLTTFNQTGT